MSSTSTGYQFVIATLIGGGISVFTTWLNNRSQLYRERQQWLRQQETERQKRYGEQLYEIYRKSISLLIKFRNSNPIGDVSERNNIYAELQEYLLLLQINCLSKNLEEQTMLISMIDSFLLADADKNSLADELKIKILETMRKDLRLIDF